MFNFITAFKLSELFYMKDLVLLAGGGTSGVRIFEMGSIEDLH